MPAVLVLVEHDEGATKKVTYEMLTKARGLGEPVAVFVGAGLDAARDGLGRHGATAIYAATGEGWTNQLGGPLTDAMEAAADRADPAAVLVAAPPGGKDAGDTLRQRANGNAVDSSSIGHAGNLDHRLRGEVRDQPVIADIDRQLQKRPVCHDRFHDRDHALTLSGLVKQPTIELGTPLRLIDDAIPPRVTGSQDVVRHVQT